MYEERKIVFDWKGFLLKLLAFIIIAFIIVKLFPAQKNVLYDQIFNNNITTMKDAAKSYYTVERLPKTIGKSETMTLQEMLNNKMLVEFVDKNGNYCDNFGSYSTITKITDDEYALKIQLSCGNHIDYIIETIGCYNVCKDNNCEIKIDTKQITEYQYKKSFVSKVGTKYCKDDYKLDGNYCYKTIKSEYINATEVYSDDSEKIIDPLISTSESTKLYTDKISSLKKEYDYSAVVVTPGKTSYVCTGGVNNNDGTCTISHIKTVKIPEVCKKVFSGYIIVDCPTCTTIVRKPTYKTVCTGGGTKTETYYTTVSATVVTGPSSYSCKAGYIAEGSGSNIKCYKNIVSYSCPASYTEELTGTNRANLKCYKIIKGKETKYCENASAILKDDGKCHLTINGEFKGYTCPQGYILDGDKCYKTSNEKINALISTKNVTKYQYKWSAATELSGWKKTGKTRLVDDTSLTNNTNENVTVNIEEDTVNNNETKNKLITDSNKELNERIANASSNHFDINLKYILICAFVIIGFTYLLFMFITSRKYR